MTIEIDLPAADAQGPQSMTESEAITIAEERRAKRGKNKWLFSGARFFPAREGPFPKAAHWIVTYLKP